MKLAFTVLLLLFIQTKSKSQYNGAIYGIPKRNISMDIFGKLDTSRCTGDYKTLKFLEVANKVLIIGDTICKTDNTR